MSHYDNCRPGYCGACGAAPGNFINGVCGICHPEARRGKGTVPPLGERKLRDAKQRRLTTDAKRQLQMFTVILKRPTELSEFFESDEVTDIYIAYVDASSPQLALIHARAELLNADLSDIAEYDDVLDPAVKPNINSYVTLAIFEGHPKTLAHGSITGWWN